jgi:hypothetical protein
MDGVLFMAPHGSATVCNTYLKYCWARRRPYIAVGKDGRRIVVDLLPVAGIGKSANTTR